MENIGCRARGIASEKRGPLLRVEGVVCQSFGISAYQRCINSVSVFSYFRVPDTSVSDTYQEHILYVSIVYQCRGLHRPTTDPDALYQGVSGVYQACIRRVSARGCFLHADTLLIHTPDPGWRAVSALYQEDRGERR